MGLPSPCVPNPGPLRDQAGESCAFTGTWPGAGGLLALHTFEATSCPQAARPTTVGTAHLRRVCALNSTCGEGSRKEGSAQHLLLPSDHRVRAPPLGRPSWRSGWVQVPLPPTWGPHTGAWHTVLSYAASSHGVPPAARDSHHRTSWALLSALWLQSHSGPAQGRGENGRGLEDGGRRVPQLPSLDQPMPAAPICPESI